MCIKLLTEWRKLSKPVSFDYLSKEVGIEMKNDNTWEKRVPTVSTAYKEDIVLLAIVDNISF